MNPIGTIVPPTNTILDNPAINPATGELTGIIVLLNSIIRIVFVVAGLWGFFNLVLAGFGFMTAGGDPKKINSAWTKIWQSLVGLLILVSSFLIAAILGILLFRDATAILQPKL